MIKPITREEKLKFTLEVQMEKALNEILADLIYEEKYTGHIDIWPVIEAKDKNVKVVVEYKKVLASTSPKSHPDAARYLINPDKGVKLVSKP